MVAIGISVTNSVPVSFRLQSFLTFEVEIDFWGVFLLGGGGTGVFNGYQSSLC